MDAILILLAFGTLAWVGFQSVQLSGGGALHLWQMAQLRSLESDALHQGIASKLNALKMETRNAKSPKSIWRTLVVADIIQQSVDSKTFLFVDPSGDRLPSFLPGQHLLIESPPSSLPQLRRCYSLSHGPGAGYYQITVKKKEDGKADSSMSVRMHEQVAIGDELRVKGPQGNFTTALAGQSPVVLLAAGIGITPMLSMLEGILAERPTATVWLYYQVRDAEREAFGARLRQLAMKHTQFQLRIFRSRSNPKEVRDQSVFSGKFGPAHIHRELGSKVAEFFMCGPEIWMQQCREGLKAIGHSTERIHSESFGSDAKVDIADKHLSKTPSRSGSVKENKQSAFQVAYVRSNTQAEWTSPSSLLDNALAANAIVESGCRAGNCGSCVTRLLKGTIRYNRKPDCDVSDRDIALCVAIPTTDLELDA